MIFLSENNFQFYVHVYIFYSTASADDEPYSPGGSDSGSLERSRSPIIKQALVDDHLLTHDLQRKMDELTRKIEEEKKQIENMGVNISGDSLVFI